MKIETTIIILTSVSPLFDCNIFCIWRRKNRKFNITLFTHHCIKSHRNRIDKTLYINLNQLNRKVKSKPNQKNCTASNFQFTQANKQMDAIIWMFHPFSMLCFLHLWYLARFQSVWPFSFFCYASSVLIFSNFPSPEKI